MTRRIRLTDKPTEKVIRVTSPTEPRVDPALVTAAVGAEPTAQKLEDALAPITLFAVRTELFRRLQSSGGRPALSGTSRRAKIPLGDAEWTDLEELAALVSGPEFNASAGQIASVLLSLSTRSVLSQVAKSPKPAASPLALDLAARAGTASANDPK